MAKRLLVVDDDLYIRELYEEVLKDEGYDVQTASNGEEALGKLQQGGFDLVLLDIMMPKLDGLGIMDALTKTPPPVKNGPILLLTNLDHEPLIKEAMDKGAQAFLIKADITPADLLAQVKKYLGETETPPAEPPTQTS
jgi:CheY-like chemotaxis protein